MATYTSNYNLEKPDYNDSADIGIINNNMDKIDVKMKEIEDKAGSGGGGGSSSWSSIEGKPFETLGNGLSVDENKVLSATGGGSGNNYSTEEQVIGTWIDGKPIYRKVLTLNGDISLTANTWFTSAVEYPKNHKMTVNATLIQTDPTTLFVVSIGKQNNNILINSPRNVSRYADYDWKLILDYTKTTD